MTEKQLPKYKKRFIYHLIEVSILLNISIFCILHIKCVKLGGSLLHTFIVSLKIHFNSKNPENSESAL